MKKYVVALGALAGGALLLRRAALREDLAWEELAKPGTVTMIDGFPVHYLDRGSGPAIVLIHGFGGQTFSYRKIIPALASAHRVIAVDLMGFGYSGRSATADQSHAAQAQMLRKLLDHLGIGRATLAGHSMGGAVAQRFAASHPERTDALILIDSVAANRQRFRRVPLPAPLLRPALPFLGAVAAKRLLEASFYDRSQLTDEVREEYMRPARIRGSMDGLLKMMQDAGRDGSVDFARITMPVLILNGAHDPVAPLSAAQELRTHMPHARLVVVDRASHLPMEDRPDEVSAAILDFLSAPSSAGEAAAQ